ncbi:MAG: alginate export family protein [Bdellovibrionales bacterium]|nr:alginate export family protein [Bdellovibrionales bacterium]
MAFGSIDVASAEDSSLTKISVKGHARFRYEDTQGYGAAANSFARSGFWSIRIRPQISMTVDDMATVVFEPQFAKALGRDYSYGLTSSSGASAYNENFHAHQGYIQLNLTEGLSVRGGRMALRYGGQLIISPAEWGISGRSFDGLMLSQKSELVDIDLGHLKIVSTDAKIEEDRDLNFLYTSWKLAEALKTFELYALHESNRTGGLDESRSGYGARMKLQASGFDIGGEYSMQHGTAGFIARDETTAIVVAEAGYTFADLAKLRIGFEYDLADELWRDWYPLTKSPLGRNDVVGRRNLTAYAARVSMEPSESLKLTLDYWMFSRTKDTAPAYKTNSSTAVGSVAGSNSKDIGQAIEAALAYRATDKVELGIGAAYFIQGDYLKNYFGDRELTDFYAVANVSF